MELIESRRDGVVIVEARGRIDTVGSQRFGERLEELIDGGCQRLVVDLEHVVYISSAGFRALLIARKRVEELDGRLVLCRMSPEVRRLFDIGAFTDLFTICDDRDAGVAGAKRS